VNESAFTQIIFSLNIAPVNKIESETLQQGAELAQVLSKRDSSKVLNLERKSSQTGSDVDNELAEKLQRRRQV
jgi:hypothetical protein